VRSGSARAQIGILGLLAESKVPGSVPLLSSFKDFPRCESFFFLLLLLLPLCR
jgi:hypothetical protein